MYKKSQLIKISVSLLERLTFIIRNELFDLVHICLMNISSGFFSNQICSTFMSMKMA